MPNDFDPKTLWWLVWILGAVWIVKLAWVVVAWVVPLPVSGVEQQTQTLRHSLHYRYHLASKKRVKAIKKVSHTPVKRRPTGTPLTAYRLIAIYSTPTSAVVTLARGSKTYVLATGAHGGTVEGYTLKDADATSARFQKGQTITTLTLYEKKTPGQSAVKIHRTVTPRPTPKKPEPAIVKDDDDTLRINRSLIKEYASHPEKIWKNIGLYEVKSNGKLDGFKVRFVRKESPFGKLGLRRGDIIKAINGEPIVDYATPMRMLRSADTLDDLSLIIERNHEEQELKYEVK